MVRRRTARGLKLVKGTVCVNVSGLLVETLSPGLDDDPHMSVLTNRTVTRDTLSTTGFPTRRLTVLSSPSFLSRPWWNWLTDFSRRGGGKVESVVCFPSTASFPRLYQAAIICIG